MAKKKLLIENDYDFFLFGISCSEKAYRLCWALNMQLKTSFQKNNDIEINEKNVKEQVRFSVFAFKNEELFSDYKIIANRSGNKFLIPEFKQADYLLLVQGEFPYEEKASVLKKIKSISFVQTAFEIEPQKLKSKENLIF